MKKKLVLLAMLVSFLALSLTFLSCGDDDGSLKLRGTSWVYSMTKAEIADIFETTEAEIDGMLAGTWAGDGTPNWPLPIQKLEFPSDNDFTLYYNTGYYLSNTPTWEESLTGTYTISGNTVTLNVSVYNVSLTCTVKGRTLTITADDGTTTRFQKQ
jgi:hypothetical protein